jgi:hypothetical protein
MLRAPRAPNSTRPPNSLPPHKRSSRPTKRSPAAIAEAKALLAEARARVDGPSSAQIPRATRRSAQQRLKQLEGDLQKVDAALQAEKYMEADRVLTGVKQQIQSLVTTLSRGSSSQSPRRQS